MRRIMAIGFAIAAFAFVASASSKTLLVACPLRATLDGEGCPPKLEFDLSASISPRRLPPHTLAPVALRLDANVSHDGASHPPALREAILDVDKDLALNAADVPACKAQALLGRDVPRARAACRDSIVGTGQAHIGIVSAPKPIPVTLTVFNGGLNGSERVLFVHTFLQTPEPTALIAVVTVGRVDEGLHAVVRIPRIAAGAGSILDFHLAIHRLFGAGTSRRGYLEAECPDGSIEISVPKMLFRNEAQTPGLAATTQFKGSLAVPCTA